MTMTEQDKRYNGWTNYETWAMALWISNDEWSYNYSLELAQEARDEIAARTGLSVNETGHLAQTLRDWKEESLDSGNEALSAIDGFLCDLLNAAWSEINWYEIAGNILSGLPEED